MGWEPLLTASRRCRQPMSAMIDAVRNGKLAIGGRCVEPRADRVAHAVEQRVGLRRGGRGEFDHPGRPALLADSGQRLADVGL